MLAISDEIAVIDMLLPEDCWLCGELERSSLPVPLEYGDVEMLLSGDGLKAVLDDTVLATYP